MASISIRRAELEGKLMHRLGRTLTIQERRVLAALAEHPEKLTQGQFWDEQEQEFPWMRTLIGAAVMLVAMSMVPKGTNELVVKLIRDAAERRAREYTLGFIKGINDSSRAIVTDALDKFLAGQIDRAEMERIIGQAFSPARAQCIATTETTRAFSEGQLAAGRELTAWGLNPVYTFHTSKQNVCDDCDALDGEEVDESQFPPLHPNCQCTITMAVREAE